MCVTPPTHPLPDLSAQAHVHHFAQYVDPSVLSEARETLKEVRDAYQQFEGASPPAEVQPLLDRLVSYGAPT